MCTRRWLLPFFRSVSAQEIKATSGSNLKPEAPPFAGPQWRARDGEPGHFGDLANVIYVISVSVGYQAQHSPDEGRPESHADIWRILCCVDGSLAALKVGGGARINAAPWTLKTFPASNPFIIPDEQDYSKGITVAMPTGNSSGCRRSVGHRGSSYTSDSTDMAHLKPDATGSCVVPQAR